MITVRLPSLVGWEVKIGTLVFAVLLHKTCIVQHFDNVIKSSVNQLIYFFCYKHKSNRNT